MYCSNKANRKSNLRDKGDRSMIQRINNFLRQFEVNGYKPLAMFNIVLAAITIVSVVVLISMTDFYHGFTEVLDMIVDSDETADRICATLALVGGPVSLVVLFIRNLQMKSVPKFIWYMILQYLLGAVLVAVAIVVIIFLILASFSGGNTVNEETEDTNSGKKKYTDEEERYARAQGYYDAATANQQGLDTSYANMPGFRW